MRDCTRPHGILIVEDNDDDFEATERALLRNRCCRTSVKRCRDGADAWTYLQGEGRYAGDRRPEPPLAILLDLNMPGLDGRKLLSRLKADAELRRIPVIVMTTSTEQEDIRACYQAGANTYFRKPNTFEEFSNLIACLKHYWLQLALLPR